MYRFDYFAFEDRPLVVCRKTDTVWELLAGEWKRKENPELTQMLYENATPMKRETFVRTYSYAAIQLMGQEWS